MIPLLALALTVAMVISEFKKQVYDLVVLGDRTEVPGVWVGAKRRIADLKRWGQISGSEKAVNEAIRLEKAL